MENWTRNGAFINRRSIMSAISALPFLGNASEVMAAGFGEDLEGRIAQQVRSLAAGKDITLRLLLPEGSEANIIPVISRFSGMTGLKVEITKSPVDELTTELSLDSFARTRRFDVALPATFGIPDLVASNALLSLDTYSNRYEPIGFRSEILYGIGDHFDGKTYGFQADGDAYLMFYNKLFLEDSNFKNEYEDRFSNSLKRPETWEELDQQMEFFNSAENERWGGLLFRTPGYVAWEWWVRFHAKGIWPFSAEMEPQILSDSGIQALEEMIRATDSLCPDSNHLGLFENWERYSKGDIYCNIGWGGSQKFLNQEGSPMRDRMIFGPMPGGIIDSQILVAPYFNWGWNYVVPMGSEEPEISYLFALFASTPAMSTLAVRQKDGYFDPFRSEHYDDPGIQKAYSVEFLEVHRASLQSSIPDLYLKNRSEYFRILSEWLIKALRREVSAKKALSRVSQRWQVITQRSGREEQIMRWEQLRNLYPKSVSSLMRHIS